MRNDEAAVNYLRETSSRMADKYLEDCTVHAVRIAGYLRQGGCEAWIGSIREVVPYGDRELHQPLIPLRFAGRKPPTWNVHYVCCSENLAYEPLIGEPVPVDELALLVFGRPLPVREVVSTAEVAASTQQELMSLLKTKRYAGFRAV